MSGPILPPSHPDADGPSPVLDQPSAPPGVGKTTQPIVPDYELIRRIGGGAYGEVWLARSQATGALRAAKIVWRHTFENDRPFKREFEGIQRFEKISREHPSQLALFHIGRNEAAGYFYYVMELADDAAQRDDEDGGLRIEDGARTEAAPRHPPSSIFDPRLYKSHTLRADLEKGRLSAAKVLEIGLALSEALSHLHSNGLVHRDVKPSNVIFVNGRPKLADIGLVTDASDQCSIVGTEGYLPPEGPGTPQADIFALGKVLYEAATGLDRRTFPDLPPEIRSWPDTAQVFELNQIILKACTADVRQRFQSAQEMFAELTLLQQGKSIKGRRVMRRRLLAVRAIGLAATAVVLVAAGVAFLWQTMEQRGGRASPGFIRDDTAGTHNSRAAKAYQLGLPALRRGTPEGARQAREYFTEAVNADARFVAAQARLFETYLLSEDHGFPPVEGTAQALNDQAAQLNRIAPATADTHAAVAIIRFINEWRWNEAEKEFKQALKIDPNCRMALTYYGYFLVCEHRPAAARVVLEEALNLDPASPVITKFLGHCEYEQRHFEEALRFYLRASELEPSYSSGHYWAGRAYLAMTNYSKGLAEMEQHEMRNGSDPSVTKTRYEGFRKAVDKDGPRGFWLALVEEQKPNERSGRTPYLFAGRYAHLGDKEQARVWLETTVAKHDSMMQRVLLDEFWDEYRHEDWFKDILKSVGLDPWQR